MTYGDRTPFVMDGPGDYEILGNFVKGLLSETTIDAKPFINTIYTLTFDDIEVLFLGRLSSKTIPDKVREAVESVDIVFVSLGDLSGSDAYSVAKSFNPAVIIPVDYDATSLKVFLKESGDEKLKPQEKYTVKAKDLKGKEADVIVLSA